MGEFQMKPGPTRAFFLDRDGTINFDRVYINNPDLIELIPGSAEAIRKLNEAGFKVIVVSNQSGIGRGLIDAVALPRIHKKLDELLMAAAGAVIDGYEYCPHRPEDACACRKPKTELVERAAAKFHIDLARSFFVGDSWVDIECGHSAGCSSILVRTGKGMGTERRYSVELGTGGLSQAPKHIADDLAHAVDWALPDRDS